MDPLGITAAALGINTFAITSIKQIHDIINNVTEAKEVIHDISTSLAAILIPLNSLRKLHIPDSDISAAAKADLEKAGGAEAVNRCGDLCDDFAKRLERWTKHSSGSKPSLRDRLTISFWNREKIRTLRISVMIQTRSEQRSGADRENMKQQLQVLETKIEAHLELTQQRSSQVSVHRGDVQFEAAEAEDDAQGILAIQEVDEQAHILEEAVVSSAVLHTQVLTKLTNQTIGDVLTEEGSSAMVGMPNSVEGKINQLIGDVTTKATPGLRSASLRTM